MREPLGQFLNFDEAIYHADPGLGSGAIKALSESPAAYDASVRFPFVGNDSTDFGSAFHMRLLQPERYAKYVVELNEDVSFATKEGKELKRSLSEARAIKQEELIFLKPDKVAVLKEMLRQTHRLAELLNFNPFAEPGGSEVAYFWNEGDVRAKALVDKAHVKYNILFDIKTARGPLDERSILRTAVDYGWATQSAWYTRGVQKVLGLTERPNFIFVVFQTTPPFSMRILPVPEETIALADKLIAKALENYLIYTENKLANKLQDDPNSGILNLTYPNYLIETLEQL